MSCGPKETGSQNKTGVDNSIFLFLELGKVPAVEGAVFDSDGDGPCCCL